MRYFDFSAQVLEAQMAAEDFATRLSAKTTVHQTEFPNAVVRAGFEFLTLDRPVSFGQHDLIIGAAPWSDPDLAALDELATATLTGTLTIRVFDVDDIPFEQMEQMLRGLKMFWQTPVVLQFRHGELTYLGQGHDAVLWMRQL